jgi:hypothetical protein
MLSAVAMVGIPGFQETLLSRAALWREAAGDSKVPNISVLVLTMAAEAEVEAGKLTA